MSGDILQYVCISMRVCSADYRGYMLLTSRIT